MITNAGAKFGFLGERASLEEILPANNEHPRSARFFHLTFRLESGGPDPIISRIIPQWGRSLKAWLEGGLLYLAWRYAEMAATELRALAVRFHYGQDVHEPLDLAAIWNRHDECLDDGCVPNYLIGMILARIAEAWKAVVQDARKPLFPAWVELRSHLRRILAAGGKSRLHIPLN